MPSYQFNHFTGGLKKSSYFQPLYPIKPVPLERIDSPKMIWDIVNTKAAKTDVPKTSAAYSTLPPKLAEKMKKFQVDVSKPVYIMGGAPDKILLGITLAIGVVCTVMSIDFLARQARKK